jgi:hypothetical protein
MKTKYKMLLLQLIYRDTFFELHWDVSLWESYVQNSWLAKHAINFTSPTVRYSFYIAQIRSYVNQRLLVNSSNTKCSLIEFTGNITSGNELTDGRTLPSSYVFIFTLPAKNYITIVMESSYSVCCTSRRINWFQRQVIFWYFNNWYSVMLYYSYIHVYEFSL